MANTNSSIRRQLLLMTSVVLLIINGAIFWTANLYANRAARLSYDRLLLGAVLQIAENINAVNARVLIDLPRSAFETLAMAPSDHAYYAVIGPDHKVLTGYLDLPGIPFGLLDKQHSRDGQQQPNFYNQEYRGRPVRFIAVKKRLIDADRFIEVYIVVGQTLTARTTFSGEMSWFVMQFVILFFAVTLLLLMFGIWRVLRPLQTLKRAIEARSPLELSPLTLPVPSEISPLVESINRSNSQLNTTLDRLKRFTAEAAHQIRTPLAGLHSQAQNAVQETDETLRQLQLKRILECSDLLTDTVTQILSQATLTHRFQSEPLKKIALDQLTKAVCRDVVVWALEQEVEIEYKGDEKIAIQGDEFALKQMIRNLLENAVKYSEKNTTVEVCLQNHRTDTRREVVLQIRDQGAGVSDEEKLHIFERFYRSPNNRYPGTGLGLAIAKEVAEHHNAQLRLKDNQPRGLVVEVVFPETGGFGK